LERCRGDDRSLVGQAIIGARRLIRLNRLNPDSRGHAAAQDRRPCKDGFRAALCRSPMQRAPQSCATHANPEAQQTQLVFLIGVG
jgi:hypothetical protein